jgi:uncharacterized protein YaaW (UPF0174 family)
MMPNPKKVKPTTNQDYASIYEDNFVKRNDPVQLGQQAYTRQLTQGVQGSLQKPTAQPAVAQGSYYDRIPSIDRPVVSDTGFAFTGANPTFIDPDSNTLTGGSGGGAGTASGGSSGGYTSGAGTGYGVGEGAGSQTADGSLGSGGASGIQTAISGQIAMIEKPVGKVVGAVDAFAQEVEDDLRQAGQIVAGDIQKVIDTPFVQEVITGLEIAGNIVGEDIKKVASTVAGFLEKNVQQPIAKAVTDVVFAVAGGDEEVVKKVVEEVTPFLQESVDPYFTGEKTVFDDMGIEVPGWLTDKNPTTVFDDYENAFAEAEVPSLPGDTSVGGTKKPNDIRTGGGETKGGELTLEDADTGDYSQVVIEETSSSEVVVNDDTGESSTDDLNKVSKGVTNQVQTRMTELTTQLTQQISEAEQFYAREYDRILNQIAMRGRQSQVGGFTGGIQEQIAQFASAAEIQQLNALAVERNSTIQGLQAQFADIPLQAQKYANELLSAELQNENIRTQALSTLYTDVLNGVRTIEEAQAFADQYGLGNVQQLMDRVRLSQLTLNPRIDEEGNVIAYTMEDLQTMYPDKTPEELQEILDTINAGNQIQDYGSLSAEEQALAQSFEETLNGRLTDADGALLGATALGTVATFLAVFGPVGWGLGTAIVIGGLIAGAFTGSNLTVGQDDLNDVVADFGRTNFFKEDGIIQGLFTASSEVSITDPSAIADQKVRGYGELNDIFTITVDGKENSLEGYQLLTLAMSLYKQGVLDDPANAAIKETADRIYKSMPAIDGARILGGLSGDVRNTVYKLYKQNVK